jgi:hypothetical protein
MKTTIGSILVSRYGTTLLDAPPESIEWAANKLAEETDVATAGKAWRRANGKRAKFGVYPPLPAYGTALYAAYFAK